MLQGSKEDLPRILHLNRISQLVSLLLQNNIVSWRKSWSDLPIVEAPIPDQDFDFIGNLESAIIVIS
jgi:hypothetical protein